MTSSTTRKRSTPKRAENTTEAKASTKSQAKESDYGKRVHEKEESLLTSTSGFDNYRGLINLCLILLVLSNFRVALDNLLKYGLLIDPLQVITIFLEDPYHWPSASLVIFSNVLIQLTFVIEKLLAAGKISERIGRISHMFLLLLMLFVPCTVILVYLPPPWAANIAVFWYTIVWLKLISYVSVNLWYRLGLMKHEEKGHVANGKPETLPLVKYPENLTQKDLYYFIFAPTLCYELNYPRSERIRKRFLLRRLAEFFFIIGIVIGAFQQWIVPTVKNSMKPIQEMDVGRGLERIMKLAVPNHLLWLLFFYAFFHSGLNILAELLRFGDRTFYRDWWNSPNVAYFWQNWNIPVHRWARRHLYIPMLRSGYSSLQAQVAVFLLSAFFHEVTILFRVLTRQEQFSLMLIVAKFVTFLEVFFYIVQFF